MGRGVELRVETARGDQDARSTGVVVRLLGPLSIRRDGVPVDLPASRKLRALPLSRISAPPERPWAEISEHWLSVEIVSRSSRVYDREFKRDAYLALGVREVWLVDVRDRSIEVCVRKGAGRVIRDALTWSAPDGDVAVHVELEGLFSDIVLGDR